MSHHNPEQTRSPGHFHQVGDHTWTRRGSPAWDARPPESLPPAGHQGSQKTQLRAVPHILDLQEPHPKNGGKRIFPTAAVFSSDRKTQHSLALSSGQCAVLRHRHRLAPLPSATSQRNSLSSPRALSRCPSPSALPRTPSPHSCSKWGGGPAHRHLCLLEACQQSQGPVGREGVKVAIHGCSRCGSKGTSRQGRQAVIASQRQRGQSAREAGVISTRRTSVTSLLTIPPGTRSAKRPPSAPGAPAASQALGQAHRPQGPRGHPSRNLFHH